LLYIFKVLSEEMSEIKREPTVWRAQRSGRLPGRL